MAIDPSIPLGYNPQPLGTDPNKLLSMLRDVQQYKRVQQQQQQQNMLREILTKPGSIDKSGSVTPDAQRQIMGVDPAAGLQIREQTVKADQARAMTANTQSESAIRRLTLLNEGNTEAVNIYDNAMKSDVGEPSARAQAQEFYSDYLKQLSSGGGFSGDQISQINPQFDPIRARSNQMAIQQRLLGLKESREQASENERITHDRAMESPGARDAASPYVNDITPVSGGPSVSQYVTKVAARVQSGQPIEQALVDQESGGKPEPVRKVQLKDGSTTEIGGRFQISKGTFDQYAKPGEKWGNQADMDTVSKRALDDYKTKYNNDPARIATAWYSGPGNVTPAGQVQGKTPAKAYSPPTEVTTPDGKQVLAQQNAATGKWVTADDKRDPVEVRGLSGKEGISDDSANLIAERVIAGDPQAVSGLARSTINITKVNDALARMAKERNLSGADLAAAKARFGGMMQGERTLGVRSANMEIAANEVKYMAPLALQASEKVNRTQYPTLNSILLAAEKGTGGEDVVRFNLATNSLIYMYAKFLNPNGIPTDADKARATDILSTAWAKGQFRTAVDQIQQEIKAGQSGVTTTRQELGQAEVGKGPLVPAKEPPANAAKPAAAAGKFIEGKTYVDGKGNKAIYRDGKFEDVK